MFSDLSEVRANINQIDCEILQLLAQRQQIVLQIAKIKKDKNLPLRDVKREQELLDYLVRYAKEQELLLEPEYITQMFKRIMAESLSIQKRC
ncbi:P-protein [Phocoenobacter uteri]|uniref:chorismate mutase n=1 Tax=Phocoenobacter uteri TaxID=146806 RepID=A0A379CAR6_9PAST|nr:chorismate mutase [Phocoenobacter uteri]MDG6881337.1 hypothetical protein [Phocoenobacter uteri]SUB59361.1 P-protein [Phocoenobacter uteri]